MARVGSFVVAIAFAFALVLGAGCATSRAPLHPTAPRGRWHLVATGESAETLAKRGNVPVEDFLEINGLAHVNDIHPGLLVFLLEPETAGPATSVATEAPGDSETRASRASARGGVASAAGEGTASAAGRSGSGVFEWPLAQPRVTSPFGSRWGRAHEGIDLSTPPGTPVLAAAEGVVAYAGKGIRGYGNLVVLAHEAGLLTVYAHNAVVSVRQGERVKRSQVIALSGQSGRATAPHLHFEVRRGESPVDPLPFLPPLKTQGQGSP